MNYLTPLLLFIVAMLIVIGIVRKMILKRYSPELRSRIIFLVLALAMMFFGIRLENDFHFLENTPIVLKGLIYGVSILIITSILYFVVRKLTGIKNNDEHTTKV